MEPNRESRNKFTYRQTIDLWQKQWGIKGLFRDSHEKLIPDLLSYTKDKNKCQVYYRSKYKSKI